MKRVRPVLGADTYVMRAWLEHGSRRRDNSGRERHRFEKWGRMSEVITKVRGSFVVCFHLATLIVLSLVLRAVSARPCTCVLSSLEHCTGDVVSRPRGKMVRSGVMKGKASTEGRAGGALIARPLREPRCCTPAGVSVVLPTSCPRIEDGLEGDGGQLYRKRVLWPREPSEQEEEEGRREVRALPIPASHSFDHLVLSSRSPCTRVLLLAQDRPDFVDSLLRPRLPETRRVHVQKRAHHPVPCGVSASSPPLGRELECPRKRWSVLSIPSPSVHSPTLVISVVVLVLLVISGFWSKTMGCEPATPLLFKLHPCPRRADRTEIHPSSGSRFPCSPFQPLLPLPGRTHRDSKTSTAPPPFPIPIPALVLVSIRARLGGMGAEGAAFTRRHATTLDVRRAVGVGSASLRVPGVVAARHMSCLSHLPPTVAVSAVIPWLQRLRGARGY
ncbi:hypothetical protein B0H13DRAFT_2561589 [Mycena leptocephala]|nr:hypothetical protein B0H13DRAFT_2561589 [Mycena leptocephala]